jgi:hypothetical protein
MNPNVLSRIGIITAALLIATSSIGINVINRCANFGGDDVSGLKNFFIALLVISIIILLATVGAFVASFFL